MLQHSFRCIEILVTEQKTRSNRYVQDQEDYKGSQRAQRTVASVEVRPRKKSYLFFSPSLVSANASLSISYIYEFPPSLYRVLLFLYLVYFFPYSVLVYNRIMEVTVRPPFYAKSSTFQKITLQRRTRFSSKPLKVGIKISWWICYLVEESTIALVCRAIGFFGRVQNFNFFRPICMGSSKKILRLNFEIVLPRRCFWEKSEIIVCN